MTTEPVRHDHSTKSVRIGGACAFAGDSILGPRQLVTVPGMQYLVFDYLAEMTLSAFAHARQQDPQLGYATEFIELTMREILPACARHGIKIVANCGGLNPSGCVQALANLQEELGSNLKIAYVDGDDCRAQMGWLREAGTPDFYTGAVMPDAVNSANIYLGALPIARALAMGADIVVTGRVVDSATTLGVLLHEFDWSPANYDALALASLAGHILECGTQATGGVHTDWRDIPDWENIGYPFIDFRGSGDFTVRKPEGSGGRITRGTVSEQILYEIGDPARYVLPDVTCDFTQVTVTECGPDEVLVCGARGSAPTDTYKLAASYLDGYRCVAQVAVFGIDALDKARRNGDALLGRARMMVMAQGLGDFEKTAVSVIGAEDSYGPRASGAPLREAIARVAVTHKKREALELFSREARIPGVSFAPGTTSGSALNLNSRPVVEPLYRLYTCLVRKTDVPSPHVILDGRREVVTVSDGVAAQMPMEATAHYLPSMDGALPHGGTVRRKVPLVRLAYGRSGDKGNTSNIAIIARHPSYFPFLEAALPPSAVKAWLAHLVNGSVVRYAVPGMHALNFVLDGALDGGGPASLRTDPMGKGMAQQLLEFEIDIPQEMQLMG